MFTSFSSQVVPVPDYVIIIVMSSQQRTLLFRGNVAAAFADDAPASCSAPPLQSAFRLPRLSRDAEAVTRPRMPLRPVKWEDASEVGAVVEFHVGRLDEVEVKVEVEAEEPVEEEAEARRVRTQFSAVHIAPPAPTASHPRKPGRPKGSRPGPRVAPRFDTSAPPEREEAKKALARIATRK